MKTKTENKTSGSGQVVRAKSKPPYSKYYIAPSIQKRLLDSLDQMGLALANAKHHWTITERRSYERAIRVLTWP